GARSVMGVEDVLEELEGLPGLEHSPPLAGERHGAGHDPLRDSGGVRARVRAELGELPRAPESLAAALGLPLGAVLGALTELELIGLARPCPGQRYARPLERGSKALG
ncbi:MAG TPA: hypothetical protein VEY33_07785, partial [Gemmatimonadota bacterium]|nr:hypothetical protein [Gemmatimonadota bacterium]